MVIIFSLDSIQSMTYIKIKLVLQHQFHTHIHRVLLIKRLPVQVQMYHQHRTCILHLRNQFSEIVIKLEWLFQLYSLFISHTNSSADKQKKNFDLSFLSYIYTCSEKMTLCMDTYFSSYLHI